MVAINKILIANRGEIACRIIRTAKKLGISTVAVYSKADAHALHVLQADEAVLIGPALVAESYLAGDKIIAAAEQTDADAIHPAYGFLSENAAFAAQVEKAGLIFIGPDAKAIDLMGNKAAAKKLMLKAGIACVPGYQGSDQSDKTLIEQAKKIGFPIMVKAAAGGGGRGMRLVDASGGLLDALSLARSEAENAFGSGELILEKAIQQPRHVEIQIFADTHGNVIHLGERDCSIQRRHQKVIEEAPCPIMTDELREKMGKAGVEAARAINYRGAGTVEFLLDKEGVFYFLEMNTRLQVEHPVTEEITGLDLVALQVQVATGLPLGIEQQDVTLSGHAIEVRLYAEDPADDFLPSTGTVFQFNSYKHEGVRIDSGIMQGQAVSPFYDPMVAKIITKGQTREAARRLMVKTLKDTAFFGPRNNRDFLISCLQADAFITGDFTTAFIKEQFPQGYAEKEADGQIAAMLATGHYCLDYLATAAKAVHKASEAGGLKGFSRGTTFKTPYKLAIGTKELNVTVSPAGHQAYTVTLDDEIIQVKVQSETCLEKNATNNRRFEMQINRKTQICHMRLEDGILWASIDEACFVAQNLLRQDPAGTDAAGGGRVEAPMHGRVIEVFVRAGDKVVKGDRLAIIEAMKMQHEILAQVSGGVEEVFASAEQQLGAGDMMIEIIPDDEQEA